MFKSKNNLILNTLLLGLVLILALAACTPGVAETEEPTTEPEIEITATEEPIVQVTPTEPVGPPTVLLVTDDQFDQSIFSQLESLLESLTADSGMELVVSEDVTPEMITPEAQVVIGTGANLDLNGLAANFPDVKFLAIGDPAANVADNLSLIGDPETDLRQKAFMAGYLSALISSDFKIAALMPADAPAQDVLGESFVGGGRYYCGICQPLYPPYNAFPQWHGLSSEDVEEGFRPTLNNLFNIGVDVAFIHGDLAKPELLAYMEELGIKVIGDRSPDVIRNNWVGTVTMDPVPVLQDLWPGLIAGNPGVRTSASIRLADTELGLISDARMRFFDQTAEELQSGMISFEIAP